MKKIREKIIRLKLSPKKEFSILIGVILLFSITSSVLSFFMKSWLYLSFGIAFSVIFAYAFLSRYSFMLQSQNRANLEEFVNLFSFFRIYIRNNYNVYTALKEITYFANDSLRELLNNLVKEIDEDKSVKPFVKFAKNFDEIIIEEMMISIYQIIDDGGQNNYLAQFELIFDKFSDLITEKNLRSKESSLSTLSTAPLIGSCFLIIMITIGIIGVLGDMMNVI